MTDSLRNDIEEAAGHVSKAKAQYGPGMPSAHCGLCVHFLPPSRCEIVAGRIDPEKWCRYFSKVKK